jgi:hypothetical protein
MKRNYLVLTVLIFFSMSCDYNESPREAQGSTLTQLLSDPLSKKFSLALYKTREMNALFIGDQPINDSALKKEFASIDDLKIFISENYKNPDYVFNTMYELAAIGQEIRETYPDVSNFTQSDLKSLINDGVEQEKKSLGFNSASNFGTQGECEEVLNSGIQTCGDAALVGAASCAIFTPTLFGALACGGGFYLGELVCIEDASESFKICKKNLD